MSDPNPRTPVDPFSAVPPSRLTPDLRLACLTERRVNERRDVRRMGYARGVKGDYIQGSEAETLPASARGYSSEEAADAIRRELMRRHAAHRAAGADPFKSPNQVRADVEMYKKVDVSSPDSAAIAMHTARASRGQQQKAATQSQREDEATMYGKTSAGMTPESVPIREAPRVVPKEEDADVAAAAAARDKERAARRADVLAAAKARIMKRDYKFSVDRNEYLDDLDRKRMAARSVEAAAADAEANEATVANRLKKAVGAKSF